MKEIQLTRGKISKVDDEDYEYLSQFKWQAQIMGGIWYASKAVYQKETQKTTHILMHRDILEVNDRKIKVDHKDHDGLNNQRPNLRICTHSQNISNMMNRAKGSSKYLGVYWNKRNRKWVAEITKNYKKINLGSFVYENEAGLAYNNAASKIHGEFANLNMLA